MNILVSQNVGFVRMNKPLLLALGLAVSAYAASAAEQESSRTEQSSVTSNAESGSPAIPKPSLVPLPKPETFSLGLGFDFRRSFNDDYDYISMVYFHPELELSDYHNVGVIIGGGVFQMERGTRADVLGRQPFFGEIGMVGRHFFTPSHAFVRPYFTGSMSFMLVAWDYRNDIIVDGEEYGLDYLTGGTVFAGLGLSVGHRMGWKAFGEIGAGAVYLPTEAASGFEHDMLDSFTYIGVKFGLTYSF